MSECDSVVRFDGRARDYARYRPSYPAGAIDAVLADLAPPAALRAVDLGAGTGISLALLVARGIDAIGLEPNAEMRAEARAAGLDVRDGTVTENDLAPASFELATAFQAYHWFADGASTRAILALLVPGGRVALVWNLFDRADPFTDGFCTIVEGHVDARKVAGLGIDGAAIAATLDAAGFVRRRIVEVPYVQHLDRDALLGRLRSSSSAPTDGAPYDAMVAALDALIARTARTSRDETFAVAHRTHVVLAERPNA